jgi:hypothetical protein
MSYRYGFYGFYGFYTLIHSYTHTPTCDVVEGAEDLAGAAEGVRGVPICIE